MAQTIYIIPACTPLTVELPYSLKILAMCWDNLLAAIIFLIFVKMFLSRYMAHCILATAVFVIASYIFKYKVYRPAVRPRGLPAEGLVGFVGYAVTDISPVGIVRVAGEEWTALGEGIRAGARVRIVGVEGLKLKVVRADDT